MIKWWKINGWKVRINIYTILCFPAVVVEIIVGTLTTLIGFITSLYTNIVKWILWVSLDKIFKLRDED